MLKNPRYVIAVPDLERSAAFYRDKLGFNILNVDAPGWGFFELGDVLIMAGECRNATPARDLGDHSYFAYIETADVDSYYERVRAAGVEITKSLRDEPWGMREFGLRTGDGHRMMIARPVGKE
ncbi:MAG TPA: VOC family protein [Parvularculaceae bacterium]|nr:VOC family protein [Parvularculaceae bacterium]